MIVLNQIFEITRLNLHNVPSRLGSSSVIVVGIAGVVAVLVGLLAMASGFAAALQNTSDPQRAIVLRDGSNGELSSSVSSEEFNIVSQLDGVSIASAELYVIADVPKIDTGSPANLVVRGVPQAAFQVRPEVEILPGGRRFQPGRSELIAGIKAHAEFAGLEVGNTLEFRGSEWNVVGLFEAGGGVHESEVWADFAIAQAAFRRGGQISSARLILEDANRAEALHEQIQEDPRLDLGLRSEEDFYAAQSEARTELIETFGFSVAVIMAIGAVFAALNTMYSAVSSRTVEIATLRALGFSGLPVVVSVMIEALVLAILGGIAGGALVYVVLDGYTASTLNNSSFSQVAFDFAVTPQLLQLGISWALLLGLIGGLFPAVRAARLPITTALRGE